MLTYNGKETPILKLMNYDIRKFEKSIEER